VTPAALALGFAFAVPQQIDLKRPPSGEWLGIYLLGQKAGYEFSQIKRAVNHGQKVLISIEDTTIRANQGGSTVSRRVREVKTYVDKPQGPLLSLEALHEGDGGDISISIRFDSKGTHITRTPRGGTIENLDLPPTRDIAENSDLVRLAAARHTRVEGYVFDSTTLKDKLEVVEDKGRDELRRDPGAKPLTSEDGTEKVSITEDDGKIAAETWIDLTDGRIRQTRFGGALLALPEPADVARKLGTVDLFALTRISVDKPLPTGVVPETVVYRITGLPESLRPESNRQTYRPLSDGAVELTVRAERPMAHAQRPLTTPAEDLRASPSIESADPQIRSLAKQIVGGERDAYTAATRLSRWVYEHLHKAYGVSSDRATDVLRRREGDCTEHSLLLTALARSVGIPARLVYGLVYAQSTDGTPGLLWHEWVEVFAGDWISIDPTFGQDIADATHLQLGRGDQTDAVALMGQLKISVESMSPSGSKNQEPPGAN
jgi:transglutaminase-like putative cysteine protease